MNGGVVVNVLSSYSNSPNCRSSHKHCILTQFPGCLQSKEMSGASTARKPLMGQLLSLKMFSPYEVGLVAERFNDAKSSVLLLTLERHTKQTRSS